MNWPIAFVPVAAIIAVFGIVNKWIDICNPELPDFPEVLYISDLIAVAAAEPPCDLDKEELPLSPHVQRPPREPGSSFLHRLGAAIVFYYFTAGLLFAILFTRGGPRWKH